MPCLIPGPRTDQRSVAVAPIAGSSIPVWGHTNKSLLGMYQGASTDGECPLVVDTTTPSSGTSRFGCWVCTVVDKDRSMEAMIKNEDEKIWMTPLLDLRNDLADFSQEKERRDFDPMFFELQSSLLDVEREFRGMSRRAGIYEALEDRFKACQFETEQEALEAMQAVDELRKEADKSNERSLAIVQKSLFKEADEVEAGLK